MGERKKATPMGAIDPNSHSMNKKDAPHATPRARKLGNHVLGLDMGQSCHGA